MNSRDRELLYRLIDGGMTQAKAAAFLGVSRRTVYRYLLARKYARLASPTTPAATEETR